ncbi:MAG TPA: pyruvate dehydrogenase (acetyl-transferring) E1 component subunit alpha [Polyangia bacterium]|nr:pyruvate dehydrogenase (acetyl-transferring) E1 component subunit alpha [Polyangia bacterium]
MNRKREEKATTDERGLLLALYRQMLAIRRTEEAAAKAYAQGKIGGFLHLGIGQESVCVGAISALEPTDYVIGTYREHGHYMAKGGTAKEVLAELYGKATGASKGLGGSMHLFSAKNRMLGGYGIVGGHVPLAAGVAFASKYRGSNEVTLCFFGDGSVPQGAFHEGISLAGLWKLPIVFICENNQYSMGTPLYRTLAVADVTERAAGYAVARDRFEGDDVLRVRERIHEAVERARQTQQPTLVEVITYRFRGHSMSDPGNYRTKDEIEEWKKRDPVPVARERLKSEFGVSEDELISLEAHVKAEIAEAARFAEESPPADPAHLWDYVYADKNTDPRKM